MEKLCTSRRSNAIIPGTRRPFWNALRGNFLDLRSSIFPRPLYFLDECTAMLTMPESAPRRMHSSQAQKPACTRPLPFLSLYLSICLSISFPFSAFQIKRWISLSRYAEAGNALRSPLYAKACSHLDHRCANEDVEKWSGLVLNYWTSGSLLDTSESPTIGFWSFIPDTDFHPGNNLQLLTLP